VPERNAQYVAVGQTVNLLFDSVPGTTFPGKVVRTSHAIDSVTRTLLTEIQVDNHDGRLMPGTFATVTFTNIRTLPPVIIPGDTIITRSSGAMVALVRDNTVHLQPVTIGRDYGATVEVREGLQEGDLVVVNPGDSAKDGAKVTTRMLASSPTMPDAGAEDPSNGTKTRNAVKPSGK